MHGYDSVVSSRLEIVKDNDSVTCEPNFTHASGIEHYAMMNMLSIAVDDEVLFIIDAESEEDRVLGISRRFSTAGHFEDDDLVER